MADTEFTKFAVGEHHPFQCKLPADGATLSVDGSGLMLIVVAPRLKDIEIKQFEALKEYGFYQCDSFPMGLMIWRFADNWLIESCFNRLKEKNLDDFMQADSNLFTRILIDEYGIIRSLNAAGLHAGFIKRIQRTWDNPDLDWPNYEEDYYKLCAKYKTAALWRKCYKFKHQPVEDN